MMMRHRRLCALLTITMIAAITDAALPPGYEEMLLCAPGRCLQRRRDPPRPGFTGSRPLFHECCNETHPQDRATRPSAWGALVGQDTLTALRNQGFHETECAEGSSCHQLLSAAPTSHDPEECAENSASGRLLRMPTRQAIHNMHATMDRMLSDDR
jgi:hypothetical protein